MPPRKTEASKEQLPDDVPKEAPVVDEAAAPSPDLDVPVPANPLVDAGGADGAGGDPGGDRVLDGGVLEDKSTLHTLQVPLDAPWVVFEQPADEEGNVIIRITTRLLQEYPYCTFESWPVNGTDGDEFFTDELEDGKIGELERLLRVAETGEQGARIQQVLSIRQAEMGLPVSGVVTPAVWAALLPSLHPGDLGAYVGVLQRAIGMTNETHHYDDATAEAVRAARALLGLPEGDQVDSRLWAALFNPWTEAVPA